MSTQRRSRLDRHHDSAIGGSVVLFQIGAAVLGTDPGGELVVVVV